jgi:hypothetical protein
MRGSSGQEVFPHLGSLPEGWRSSWVWHRDRRDAARNACGSSHLPDRRSLNLARAFLAYRANLFASLFQGSVIEKAGGDNLPFALIKNAHQCDDCKVIAHLLFETHRLPRAPAVAHLNSP